MVYSYGGEEVVPPTMRQTDVLSKIATAER
jgi:hypothetical protein